MIYSTDFRNICEQINYLDIIKYLKNLQWVIVPYKYDEIKIFQKMVGKEVYQIELPVDKNLSDYSSMMYNVARELAKVENRSIEEVVLEMLNPVSDILKVRISNEDVTCDGSITFDDAINLYNNSKKMLETAALDMYYPRKYHQGRTPELIQKFISQCRVGQTQIGSYISNIVCPFFEKIDSENDFEQLSIYTSEDRLANSFTRTVTKKVMKSLDDIKNCIDNGDDLEKLSEQSAENLVSINFMEAVKDLNLYKSQSILEVGIKWAPSLIQNTYNKSVIAFDNNYFSPIKSTVDTKEIEIGENYIVIQGRVKSNTAPTMLDRRTTGTVKLVPANLDSRKVINIKLNIEDYNTAIDAHKQGKLVGLKIKPGHKLIEDYQDFHILD